MKQNRLLSVYEKNQLLKYKFKEEDLLALGELPVEYLTGFVEFCGLRIKVNRNVLIPRVESEELVQLISDFFLSLKNKLSYLEIGVGSGAISLAFFAFLLKQGKIDQIGQFLVSDVSKKALILAQENFKNLFHQELAKKIKFLKSNLLDNFSKNKFNLIVANLPYIPSDLIKSLDASVQNYEPLLALDGGQTGFDLINKFLEQVINQDALANKGKIFLEVHETHDKKFLKKYFPNIEKHFLVQEIKDQFGRHRFLILEKI